MQNNEKVVYSKSLMNILVDAGFKLLRSEVNIRDTRYRVFIFQNSPELEAMIAKHRNKS